MTSVPLLTSFKHGVHQMQRCCAGYVALVQDLLSVDPNDRPPVTELLQNRLFAGAQAKMQPAAVPGAAKQPASNPDGPLSIVKKSITFMKPKETSERVRDRWHKAHASTAAKLRWRLLRVQLQRVIRMDRSQVCPVPCLQSFCYIAEGVKMTVQY
jgi:hypothetical protein